MNREITTSDERMQGQIDALVCGELVEEERRKLLVWLDEDSSRWRTCGLAFLEAQVWERALGEDADEGSWFMLQRSEGGMRRSEVKCQESAAARREPAVARRWLSPLVLVAASIAAFSCGLFWQGPGVESGQGTTVVESPDKPLPDRQPAADNGASLLAAVPLKGGPLGDMEALLQIPVRTVESAPGQALSSLPENVRRHWERRGYKLVEERRYLPAKLPDGRQVMVPVNEVKMKFVGKPVS